LERVVTEVEMAELREVAELWGKYAMEVVGREMKPPQVGEVTQLGRDSAVEAEPGEVQCHHTAAAATTQATCHTTPLACRNRAVSPR
jgi:hypothetical protein